MSKFQPQTYAEAAQYQADRPKRPRTPLARKSSLKGNGLPSGKKALQGKGSAKGHITAKGDPQLAAWGRKVKKRDGYQCKFPGGCVSGDNRLDPHHVAKRSQRPDLKYDVNNGITLCRTHHDWTDDNHDAAVKMGLLNTESYEKAMKHG